MVETQILELSVIAARKSYPFGEFLVEQGVLDRFQLFRTLQLQDRVFGARLGECAAALGFVQRHRVEELHARFAQLDGFEAMETEAFLREPEIEIVTELT